MRNFKPLYLFIISVIILNCIILYNIFVSKSNQNNFFRIHVVANSDSIKDQILKLKIADRINKYVQDICSNDSSTTYSKEEVKSVVKDNIDNILDIANSNIASHSDAPSYTAYAKVGKIAYEEKSKEDLYMPAGTYDSLQIILGEGKGENWWSLVFPYSYDGYYSEENESQNNTISINTSPINDTSSYDNFKIDFWIVKVLKTVF